jgi:putative acetyltransferase
MRISGQISVRKASIPDELDILRCLFREYQRELDIPVCFSSFEKEVAELPRRYFLLLLAEDQGTAVGCAAVQPLPDIGCCELKRFYVRPAARGKGAGRRMLQWAMTLAAAAGFGPMKLDTLPDKMPAAVSLYKSFGFVECSPYTNTPGALFLQRTLHRESQGNKKTSSFPS